MSVLFTGCSHFGHKNILTYCNRPFSDVHEMDEEMIKRWNVVVKPGDTVFHLGDFGLGNLEYLASILARLNGDIRFLMGSHDSQLKELEKQGLAEILGFQFTLSYEGKKVTMNHCSMRVWPASHYNAWHLFSHSHGKLAPFGKSFDIGVDSWSYAPVTWDEVCTKMDTLPDNFNLVKNRDR